MCPRNIITYEYSANQYSPINSQCLSTFKPLHKSVKNKTEIMEFIKDAIECVLKTPDGVDESVMVLKFDIHKIPARVKGSSALF